MVLVHPGDASGTHLGNVPEGASTHPRDVPGTVLTDDRWEVEELREELQEARLALAVAVAERHAADEIRKAEVAALRELADRLTAELAAARRPWWRKLLG